MFKFEKIMETFEPMLRNRLNTDYGNSNEFTHLWNRLQLDGKCCGILGAQDFLNKSFVLSCCEAGVNSTNHISVSRKLLASALVLHSDELVPIQKLNATDLVNPAWSHVVLGAKDMTSGGSNSMNNTKDEKSGTSVGTAEQGKIIGLKIGNGNPEYNKNVSNCKGHIKHGCREFLAEWLRNTADVLFVIGYCVITFLKLSFLGILRYEIREMIQKIRLLQNETTVTNSDQEINQNQLTQVTSTSVNGGLHTMAESKIGNYDREKERSRISFAEGERESLLIKEATPLNYLRKKHLYGCSEYNTASCAAESSKISNHGNSFECIETNYCTSTDSFRNAPNSATKNTATLGPNSGTNIKAFQDNSSTAAAAAKSLNNSYELNEFDTQTPKYRGGFNNCSSKIGKSSSASKKISSNQVNENWEDNNFCCEGRCEITEKKFSEMQPLKTLQDTIEPTQELYQLQQFHCNQNQANNVQHFMFNKPPEMNWEEETNALLSTKNNFDDQHSNEMVITQDSLRMSAKSMKAKKAFTTKNFTYGCDTDSYGNTSKEFSEESPNLDVIKEICQPNYCLRKQFNKLLNTHNITDMNNYDSNEQLDIKFKSMVSEEATKVTNIYKNVHHKDDDFNFNQEPSGNQKKQIPDFGVNLAEYPSCVNNELDAKIKYARINHESSKFNYNFYNDKKQQLHRNNENCCCCCNNNNYDHNSSSGQDI
ncbi:probable cyclin-dependent serine/threonine-protein kinase DDB_G0292550 isoform X1 [Condylostylus longicornis]|uniref:probable cyclin-dependent serine/threonine-protein kinase DDB_G0292550 isoform X1 n=1 Tax=Condylostylus longicornis TaxID=2530218 RepID=UPI00244E576F|nr:probable cyclin-dependent serine/threonine-protein kinase DDB_G0292550 isoform X1 [Condylostylus longicornis]